MLKPMQASLLLICALSVSACAQRGNVRPPVCPVLQPVPASLMQPPQTETKVRAELFEPPQTRTPKSGHSKPS